MRTVVLACLISATTAAIAADAPPFSRYEFSQIEMAVGCRIVVYAPDEAAANQATKAAFDRIRQLNGVLSDYDPQSELRRLCETAGGGKSVAVSDDLWRALIAAQTWSARSEGAFDVTIGPLARLWRRARRQHEIPAADRLQEARRLVDYRLVKLDPQKRAVELTRSGMRLDMGAIGKGFAADEAFKVLEKHGIRRALVGLSGDMRLGDPPPGQAGWRIGVAPLERDGPPSRYLSLARCGIASSGDAWQYVEIGGKRYSHIVDPRTGLGLTGRSGVTVVAPDATTADAMATTVSVLGPEKGLALVEDTPGVSAVVFRVPQDKIETHESQRWKMLPAAEAEKK
jgi:thiamine biosynthesis lipoprotein